VAHHTDDHQRIDIAATSLRRRSATTGSPETRILFWSTLKTEYYDRYEFTDHREAVHGVTSWIETVYNRRRRHSSLGQISPVTFEHQLNTAANRSRIADVHQTGSTPVNR